MERSKLPSSRHLNHSATLIKKLVIIWFVCLLPFVLFFTYKFIRWWDEIDSGITRERETGIKHTISDTEIVKMSIQSAISDSWILAAGGLGIALSISFACRKKATKVAAE